MAETMASRSAKSRAALLSVAIEKFGAKGFHGTTTRDLANGMGMSPSALYMHHKSKESLLYEISKAGHEQTIALLGQALTTSTDPAEQLRELMRLLAIHHAEQATSSRVVNYELSALEEDHAAEIHELRRRIDATVRDVVVRGQDAGVFDVKDSHMTATALLSLVIDTSRWFRSDAQWTADDVGHEYAELALRMVGYTPA